MSVEFTTEKCSTVKVLNVGTFADEAKVVSKFGQGCNYETGKCVENFQVDFSIEVENVDGEKKNFHIAFQSLDRSDNIRAYSSSEMTPAAKYGCDSDEDELENFTDYDEEILKVLQEKAENICKEWFDSKIKEKNMDDNAKGIFDVPDCGYETLGEEEDFDREQAEIEAEQE